MLFKVILFYILIHFLCIRITNGFTCSSSGNFPNPDVSDCSSFISCTGNLITGFSMNINVCKTGSVFNQKTGECDHTTQCFENVNDSKNLIKQSTFVCTNIGKYADEDSPDCRGFFACIRNLDLTLTYSLNDCPIGTTFSGEKEACVSGLKCEPKQNKLYDCKVSGYFIDNSSLDCTKYFFCKKMPNSQFEVFSRTCPNGSLFNENANGCVMAHTYECPLGKPKIEFKCPFAGNYANAASDDCKTYYQCSRDDSGELIYALQTCDDNFIFDASLRICVHSRIATCIIEPPVEEFECPNTGLFVDENTPYCKGYFLCERNRDQTYTISQNLCGNGKVFSPALKMCAPESLYNCPSLEILSQNFDCPDWGNYVSHSTDDCRTYYRCKRNNLGELIYSFLTCDVNMVFDPMRRSCVQSSLYECNSTAELPTTEFSCPGTGNYIDFFSMGCRNYYTCARNSDDILYFTSNTCESGYVYDGTLRNCVDEINYNCPIVGETTELSTVTEEGVTDELINTTDVVTEDLTEEPTEEPTEAPTEELTEESTETPTEEPSEAPTELTEAVTEGLTEDPTTSKPTTSSPIEEIACTSDGYFPDKSSENCKQFYQCVGTERYNFNCADGTIFHPREQICVLESMFSCSSTGIIYKCSETGLIMDPNSKNCTKYYFCVLNIDSFTSIQLACPPGMVFNPVLSLCVPEKEYVCPSLLMLDE